MNNKIGFPKGTHTKKKKVKAMTVSKAKKKAWDAFALWFRKFFTQKGAYPCYTCDKPTEFENIQPGHWMTGHTNTNYINLLYIRPQCKYCNLILKGNQGIFWERIEKEIGTEMFMYLREHSKDFKKISIQDYQEIEEKYKKKLKQLEFVIPVIY